MSLKAESCHRGPCFSGDDWNLCVWEWSEVSRLLDADAPKPSAKPSAKKARVPVTVKPFRVLQHTTFLAAMFVKVDVLHRVQESVHLPLSSPTPWCSRSPLVFGSKAPNFCSCLISTRNAFLWPCNFWPSRTIPSVEMAVSDTTLSKFLTPGMLCQPPCP